MKKKRLFIILLTLFLSSASLVYLGKFDFIQFIAIFSGLLTITIFLEPLSKFIRFNIFSKYYTYNQIDIYREIIFQIETSKQSIMFKTPTISWGRYSAGMWVFEKTIEALKKAKNNGVDIKIIYDIADKNHKSYLEALKKIGIQIEYKKNNVYDYYFIKDMSLLIEMESVIGTEKTNHLKLNIRKLGKTIKVSKIKKDIIGKVKLFNQEWKSLQMNVKSK